jgi:hypothetical protein
MRLRMIIVVFLVLIAGAFQWGPGPTLGLSQEQLPSPFPKDKSSTPQTSDQGMQSLLAQADQVLEQMSKLTGLPIRGPLKKEIVSRPEVLKLLTQNLHREYTPKEIHDEEATLRAFGLISQDFDFEKFLLNFYTEQAAGFYDAHTQTMYIADWIPADTQGLVLAHELTHALQDQNFNLERFMRAEKANDDAEAARQAVVEGYATAAMFQHVLGSVNFASLPSFDALMAPLIAQKMQQFPVFSRAPFFFRMQALFPYIQGTSFIGKGLAAGDWKSLNALFTAPPSTTREIFQPQAYFDHQAISSIRLPASTPLDSVPGLSKLDENTMGELGFYELLGQLLSEEKAKAITPQWVADRYIVYENSAKQSYALVARTRWETPDAALAFFREYHALLAQKYPELAPDPRSTADRFIGRASSGEVIMLLAGSEVRWAGGVPENKVDDMIEWLTSMPKQSVQARASHAPGKTNFAYTDPS